MNLNEIWEQFLANVKNKIDNLAYNTWFSETKLISLDKKTAQILVQNHVHKKHLTNAYTDLTLQTLNEITNTNFEIEFILEDKKEINETELGVPNFNLSNSNLITKYTFDTYVVGDSNKFAHATAVAVAESPGKIYNPLFLYGKSGLGKTHLMHAIGNHINLNSNKKILYVTSEQFISDFAGLSRKNKEINNLSNIEYFKKKYRDIDVLIIDDIQFLGNAEKTQIEFFNTFNNLYNDNKQIIISSDRSPDDLKLLEERLRTRFNWGLRVNIFPPDLNLRIDIINKKIKSVPFSIDIPEDVINYMASNLQTDVRTLEGAITRLYAYTAMFSIDNLNLEVAIEALKEQISSPVFVKDDMQKVGQIVANFYKISVDDLKGKKKSANIAFPRQIAIYLTREIYNVTLQKIGTEYGGRDHSTIKYAHEKIKSKLKTDNELRKIINELTKQLEKNC
ncbi:MAG: chromosomal replication initiator protein DnaA [Bacilli bacterium]